MSSVIYHFRAQCMKVNDINKVDLSIISRKDPGWYEFLDSLEDRSNANLKEMTRVYTHRPRTSKGHKVINMLIPAGTDAIAFLNDASDNLDIINLYCIRFYKSDKTLILEKILTISHERNYFALLIPEGTHYIDFSINDDGNETRKHDYELKTRCQTCLNDFSNASVIVMSLGSDDCVLQ